MRWRENARELSCIRVNKREQLLKGGSGFLRVGEVVTCQVFIGLCILFQNMRGRRLMKVCGKASVSLNIEDVLPYGGYLFTPTLPLSNFSPYLSSWPAWAYCPALSSYFSLPPLCPPVLCSPLSPPSFFSIYFLPLLPPFSSASPLLRPYCLSRCLPKVARPNVAAPFVAIAQSGRLPPCRAPLAWCRL